MKTFRVGVIGRTGKGDYGHGIDTVWAEIPNAQVVAVADEDESGRASAKSRLKCAHDYADYRKMLDSEKLDIVAIGPRWIDQHREMCVAAAEHGCHIFMEKPFCRNLVEADEIVNACEMRHIKLAIAHQTRWSPTQDGGLKLIRDGAIGQILELRGRGKEDRRGGGEDLWVLGSHIMDIFRAVAGNPISCTARISEKGEPATSAHVRPGNEGIGPLSGDQVTASFEFPGGATGYFSSRREAGKQPSRFGVQVFGTEGVIEFLTGYPSTVSLLRDPSWSPLRSGKSWEPVAALESPENSSPGNSLHGGNVAAVKDLLSCIETDRQPRCSMYDARWTIEMIQGVIASHAAGGRVSVPLKERKHPWS